MTPPGGSVRNWLVTAIPASATTMLLLPFPALPSVPVTATES
jgi:hypothetical protein